MNPRCSKPWLAAAPVALFALLALPARPTLADPHSVEGIVAALESPISPAAIEQAREFDHRVTSAGEYNAVQVHVVTGKRSTRVEVLAGRLLRAAGQDPANWTVRVLDTEPTLINAFVLGGKYVYVDSGLLAQDPGDDELAFILGHALGHSLLKHQERRADGEVASLAEVAGLSALLSPAREPGRKAGADASAFRGADEQEADALGTCIARRAGFDALRGADYFTRSKRDHETRQAERAGNLARARSATNLAEQECERMQEASRNSLVENSKESIRQVSTSCQEAQTLRLSYSQISVAYNAGLVQERRNILLAAHPQESSRVAAISAVEKYLAGRQDLAALANHEPSRRVLAALQQTGSGLVSPGGRDSTAVSPRGAGQE